MQTRKGLAFRGFVPRLALMPRWLVCLTGERPTSSWLPSRGRPSVVLSSDAASIEDSKHDGGEGGFEDAIREEMEAMRAGYERKIRALQDQLDSLGVRAVNTK
jgi:hypothetical protein